MSARTDRARERVTHFEVLERLPAPLALRASKPAARTRSAPTSPQSATRSSETPSTGGRASGRRLGLERQFLHAST